MAELLSHSQLTQEQGDQVATCRNAAAPLLVLINDILDLSKIDAGKLTLEQRPFNLYSLLDSVVNLFEPKATEAGLTVNWQRPSGHAWLLGDATRLRQITSNLLEQCHQVYPSGGITISVDRTAGRYLRHAAPAAGYPRYRHRHDPEQMSKVFTAFEQADSTTTRRYGGTGWGWPFAAAWPKPWAGVLMSAARQARGAVSASTGWPPSGGSGTGRPNDSRWSCTGQCPDGIGAGGRGQYGQSEADHQAAGQAGLSRCDAGGNGRQALERVSQGAWNWC
jgi:signal transduction histidine kinase